jgi:hypothetical protein
MITSASPTVVGRAHDHYKFTSLDLRTLDSVGANAERLNQRQLVH